MNYSIYYLEGFLESDSSVPFPPVCPHTLNSQNLIFPHCASRQLLVLLKAVSLPTTPSCFSDFFLSFVFCTLITVGLVCDTYVCVRAHDAVCVCQRACVFVLPFDCGSWCLSPVLEHLGSYLFGYCFSLSPSFSGTSSTSVMGVRSLLFSSFQSSFSLLFSVAIVC